MAQPKVKADVPIETLLKEKRKFPPPKAFVKNAVMNRKSIYAEASRNFALHVRPVGADAWAEGSPTKGAT